MSIFSDLSRQAVELNNVLSKSAESDIILHADDLLLFLNKVQDIIHKNPKSQISLPHIDDIIYELESNPESTLKDESILLRLQNIFSKLTTK